jgi:hypothetical protein
MPQSYALNPLAPKEILMPKLLFLSGFFAATRRQSQMLRSGHAGPSDRRKGPGDLRGEDIVAPEFDRASRMTAIRVPYSFC